MFTGIVEELGTVESFHRGSAGARLRIRGPVVYPALSEGASIAVNGVCLTAVDLAEGTFAADLAPETLSRTNLGDLKAGSRVNLERPVTPSTLLSGHIMQGHIDGTGELVTLKDLGEGNWWLDVRVPEKLERYLVHKGSIAIDGISLTIAALDGNLVSVTIIPHTFTHTTLGSARVGSRLNIEVDVLAKHVEKLLAFQTEPRPSGSA
jgi:riboflavin synthase